MFVLSVLEDDVRVLPSDLTKAPLDAVTDVLQSRFLDKVIPDLGLVITVYDVTSIEGGFVYPNDGAAYFKTVFRLVIFRPFLGEVLVGKLKSSTRWVFVRWLVEERAGESRVIHVVRQSGLCFMMCNVLQDECPGHGQFGLHVRSMRVWFILNHARLTLRLRGEQAGKERSESDACETMQWPHRRPVQRTNLVINVGVGLCLSTPYYENLSSTL